MTRATNREIEIKLRILDLPALLQGLGRIRASFEGRVFEQNTIYDTPDSAFRRTGRLLRLRLETPAPRSTWKPGVRPKSHPRRAILTTKAPPGPRSRASNPLHYKERLERELVVRNPSQWPRTLNSLGVQPSFIYEKFRSTFELPGLHLDLDETPAGTFLELEGSPHAIARAARALGFSSRDYYRGTYWDVHAADCRHRGRRLKNMVFPA
jgi:adenylate cyclase, class 2